MDKNIIQEQTFVSIGETLTCSIVLLPCKLLLRQDSGGWKGTEQTGYKDSNQFHACAVTVENKMLSARI